MKKGDIGYLINFWKSDWMEEFFNYDFGYERSYLMGHEGAYITGSDFLMDGGVTAAYWFGELAEVR